MFIAAANNHCTTILTKYSRSRKLGMGMSNSLGIDTSMDVVDRHIHVLASSGNTA